MRPFSRIRSRIGWISSFFEPRSSPSAMFSKSKRSAMRGSAGAAPVASGLLCAADAFLKLGLSQWCQPELELDCRPLVFEDDLGVRLDPAPALRAEERLDDIVRLHPRGAQLA